MTGSPQKMMVRGSLFSSTSAKAPVGRQAHSRLGHRECQCRHHHTEKKPCFCTERVQQLYQGMLCQQSLNSAARCFFRWAMIHKNLLLGNAVQHTPSWFVQPAWIQSLPLVPHFWDLWYKWAVFCFPQLFTWENSRACLFRSPSYVRSRPGPYPASC